MNAQLEQQENAWVNDMKNFGLRFNWADKVNDYDNFDISFRRNKYNTDYVLEVETNFNDQRIYGVEIGVNENDEPFNYGIYETSSAKIDSEAKELRWTVTSKKPPFY